MTSTDSRSGLFVHEAFDLLGNTTILGVSYGITFTLYCLCTRLLYFQFREPDKGQRARFAFGYTSLVFFCALARLILSSRGMQLAYVENADFPGGPMGYERSYDPVLMRYITANSIFDTMLEVLTMAVQIWRLQVIWSGTQSAVAVSILPLLLLLSFIGLAILGNIVASLVPMDRLGVSPIVRIKIDTASYAILSAFTILVTGLISMHLLLVRRRHVRIIDTSGISSIYLGAVAMLVESYALEAAWSIATAISKSLNSPSSYMFVGNDATIKAIAYFLVVYRVASGRAWAGDTERKLTTLQWNHDAQTATNETSGSRSQVPEAMHSSISFPPLSHSALVV